MRRNEEIMYETLNEKDFSFLSPDDREFLGRIAAYSEEVLGDIEDPQKVRISEQLDKLKPIMQKIADEKQLPLEDVFIRYMDLSSQILAKKEQQFKDDIKDLGTLEF